MDERFEKLLQNLLNEVLINFDSSQIISSTEFMQSYALSSHFACSVIEKVLLMSGFEDDLSDFLKVKDIAAYQDFLEVRKIFCVVPSLSDAGSTSAQCVS